MSLSRRNIVQLPLVLFHLSPPFFRKHPSPLLLKHTHPSGRIQNHIHSKTLFLWMSEQGRSDYDYDDEDYAGDYYYSSDKSSQGDEPPPSETESDIHAPRTRQSIWSSVSRTRKHPHPHNSTRRHRAHRLVVLRRTVVHSVRQPPRRVPFIRLELHPLTISTTIKPKETMKNSEKPTNGLLETSLVGLLTSVSAIFQTLYYFVLLLLIPLFLLHRLPPSQKTAASHRALSA